MPVPERASRFESGRRYQCLTKTSRRNANFNVGGWRVIARSGSANMGRVGSAAAAENFRWTTWTQRRRLTIVSGPGHTLAARRSCASVKSFAARVIDERPPSRASDRYVTARIAGSHAVADVGVVRMPTRNICGSVAPEADAFLVEFGRHTPLKTGRPDGHARSTRAEGTLRSLGETAATGGLNPPALGHARSTRAGSTELQVP